MQPGPWGHLSPCEAQGLIPTPSCRSRGKTGGQSEFVQPEAAAKTHRQSGGWRLADWFLRPHKDAQDTVLVFAETLSGKKIDGCYSMRSHRLKGVRGLWAT